MSDRAGATTIGTTVHRRATTATSATTETAVAARLLAHTGTTTETIVAHRPETTIDADLLPVSTIDADPLPTTEIAVDRHQSRAGRRVGTEMSTTDAVRSTTMWTDADRPLATTAETMTMRVLRPDTERYQLMDVS